MKNKKVLIIVMTIIIVVVAVCGFLYYQNAKKIEEEELNEKIRKEEIEEKEKREEAKKVNEKFLKYQNRDILGIDVTTIMLEADTVNVENLINKGYRANSSDNIEVYIELKSEDGKGKKKYSMEEIQNNGIRQFSNLYAMSKFEMKDIEYNEKTGQIKSLVLSEK